MILSHAFRYVFIKTRKTGGTSVEIALSRHVGPRDTVTPLNPEEELRQALGGNGPQNLTPPVHRWTPADIVRFVKRRGRQPVYYNHMPAAQIRRYVGTAWDRYFKFTIERNPWDLAVSAWWWQRSRLGKDRPFDQFVYSPDLQRYSNWKLYTIHNELAVDEVIRYDDLAEGLRRVTEDLGLPRLELTRAKSEHRKDRRPYQEWYTNSLELRIADVFHEEIEHFGWTFDQ